jgi:kynureninase
VNAATATAETLARAIGTLGDAPLTEAAVSAHIAPLFSRVLKASRDRAYLANHSLGRPLDATADDVQEGLAAWYARMGDAWDVWDAEMTAFRNRIAALLGVSRADCVVPKTSAGQGLRAVLNTYDAVPRVVATRGEFDSLDVILREYARRGRIALRFVEPDEAGLFAATDLRAAIEAGADLIVLSQVVFNTGQVLPDLSALIASAHAVKARVLLDVYHSLAVIPVDLAALDADFAVGGSYKYLRGGPGACFLYVHPRHVDAGLRTLDTGWFAKETPFAYRRPDPPRFAPGGDGWLESTPAVLPLYQARAGQILTQAIGVGRLRANSLVLQRRLRSLLAERGIAAAGGTIEHGAFLVLRDERAVEWAERLESQGIRCDARGLFLRLCPDVLTRDEELVVAADAVAALNMQK